MLKSSKSQRQQTAAWLFQVRRSDIMMYSIFSSLTHLYPILDFTGESC